MHDDLLLRLARIARDNPAMRPLLLPLIQEARVVATVETPARGAPFAVKASYEGNPNGQPIYDHAINHGYDEPLAGGTDVMRRLQNQLRKEQGLSERPPSPEIPKTAGDKLGAAYNAVVGSVFVFAEVVQEATPKNAKLRALARKAHALLDEIHRALPNPDARKS